MKKGLFIGLALVLALTALMPLPALAAKPVAFNASGFITSISPGDVLPAGKSDRWRVILREVSGTLSGDIGGGYTMTYKANVDSEQAGNLHGRLVVDKYVLNVNGKIQPLEFVGWYAPGIPLLKLTLSGHWNFIDGAHGEGSWDGWAVFIPTPDGHVYYITASAFNLTGQWQP